MKTKYGGLTVVCNGCGKAMRDMGVWPTQFPKNPDTIAGQQFCTTYTCTTCRLPHPDFEKGVPFLVRIIETDLEGSMSVEVAA